MYMEYGLRLLYGEGGRHENERGIHTAQMKNCHEAYCADGAAQAMADTIKGAGFSIAMPFVYVFVKALAVLMLYALV